MSVSEKACGTCDRIIPDENGDGTWRPEDTCKGCGCVIDSILDKLQDMGCEDSEALDIIEAALAGRYVKRSEEVRHAEYDSNVMLVDHADYVVTVGGSDTQPSTPNPCAQRESTPHIDDKSKDIVLSRACPLDCPGTRFVQSAPYGEGGEEVKCGECGGSGEVFPPPDPVTFHKDAPKPCPTCGGSGRKVIMSACCDDCGGKGEVE